jgi:hypothetical protein
VHVLNLHHFAKHLGHIWIMCTQVDHFAMHVVHMWTMCLELHHTSTSGYTNGNNVMEYGEFGEGAALFL